MEIRKITEDDFIPDMIGTLNSNFSVLEEAINDLDEIINDGECTFKSVQVNDGGTKTDQAVSAVGKITASGDIETVETLKSKVLTVSNNMAVGGASTFGGNATFAKESAFNAGISTNGVFNIKGDKTVNIRRIQSANDTDTISTTGSTYDINVTQNYYIIIDELSTGFNTNPNFKLTTAKANQSILVKINAMATNITIQLSPTKKLQINNPNEVFQLVYNSDTVEWEVFAYSMGLTNDRFIN